MYNDLFNKWTERLKAQRGIDINEYQVIQGPEYRTKGSQLVIRDPKMVEELDQAARIREIATDMPDPLNRPAEILEMWGKPPAPATPGRPAPSAPPASKPSGAPQPAAGAKPPSVLQPPPKQPTPGPNGAQPGPARSSGPFTTLSTGQGSAVFSDTDMTMVKISEHPNLPGIRAGLEKRGAVLVEDRAMTATATADVGYVEVTGPDGTSFTRAVVRYNPDSAVLQDLWHEMDHLLDFQSGKIPPTYTIVAEDAAHFRELQAKSVEDLMTVGRAAAPKISEMSVVNLGEAQARRFVAEMRNHLRDIEELPGASGSGYVENAQKAVKGFREILKNMVKTGKVRGARVLEAAERQALKDFIRKYVMENFPDLPAAYNRAFPRQEFWDFLQEEASTLPTPGTRPRLAQPVGEAGQVAAATRTPAAPPTRSRQPSTTPTRTSPVAAPRLVAEPPQPVNPTSVTLGKQLSHGGDIGALGAREPGTYGVFEANMPDGTPVAVKVYPDTPEFKDMFPLEIQAAQAASKTSVGPRFYGEVQVGPGRRAFAMERIEGNFPAARPSIGLATEAQEIEAMITQGKISDKTLEDVQTFGEELLGAGHYYTGEVQGLIDTAGRFRPIDFQGVRKLSLNPAEQAEQIATHWRRVQVQIDYLKQLRDELRKK